jgi:trans-2,3-dihydro-3-hydroxyanthranilate isomerase
LNKLKFKWVDAFTDSTFGGNPCAVVFGADCLNTNQMQTLTREMNLSETAFILESKNANFAARYFTPSGEIPLAGHPTISVMHCLMEEGTVDQSEETATYQLELKAGIIDVETTGNIIKMSQMKPSFLSEHSEITVARIFGLSPEEFIQGVPIQTVSTGSPQLMIPVRSQESLKKAHMNFDSYLKYRSNSDFTSAHLFCTSGMSSLGDTSARHLCPPPDPYEDAFTGSGTGAMAAYLWKYSLINSPNFVAEQGHWMGRPGRASVEVFGPANSIATVKVSGEAKTLISGEIYIPDF